MVPASASPAIARSGATPFRSRALAHGGEHGIPRAFEELIRWTIEQEPHVLIPYLSSAELESFSNYYRALPSATEPEFARRHLAGLWSSEAGWAYRWLMWRAGAGCGLAGDPRVLDAGCGFGTFSMLFAALGSEVTGIDLREDRLRVAEARLVAHRLHAARRLAIDYRCENVLDGASGPFDLIWLYNAISHIDPPERFLESARHRLAPGGVLVIGDINGANPSHRRRLNTLRSEVHQRFVTRQGAVHPYAAERTFSPNDLRAIATRLDFRVIHHELFYPGHARLPAPLARLLMEPIQRCWWFGQPVARRQLFVATPDLC